MPRELNSLYGVNESGELQPRRGTPRPSATQALNSISQWQPLPSMQSWQSSQVHAPQPGLEQLTAAVTNLSVSMQRMANEQAEAHQWRISFTENLSELRNVVTGLVRPNESNTQATQINDRQPTTVAPHGGANATYNVAHADNNNDVVVQAKRRQSVPIHKWGWKFSANKSAKEAEKRDLAAFFKKLELFRSSEGLTYEDIHKKFHFLVEGSVYEWYMQYRSSFANWQQLVDGLRKQFTTPLTTFHKFAALNERRQKKEESAMDYIASVQREFDELSIENEQEKIAIIQNGLKDQLRLVAMSQRWETVQQMDLHLRTVEVADELRRETDLKARKPMFNYPKRGINACEMSELESVSGPRSGEDKIGSEDEFEFEKELSAEVLAVFKKARFYPNRRANSARK